MTSSREVWRTGGEGEDLEMALRVAMITSWNVPTGCGIEQHSKLMMEGVQAADPSIEYVVDGDWLSPQAFYAANPDVQIVHWNWHAALHSRWESRHVEELKAMGRRVIVSFHDTLAGTPAQPNSDRAKELAAIADAFIVHEPVADIPQAIYWRHGVPAIQRPALEVAALASNSLRPLVGSAGFNFGWKNFDLLCEAAALAGWRVLLIGPNFTQADAARWRQWQPEGIFYLEQFPSQAEVVSALTACDATAFLYNNANTGVSGAVRFGIAARKPCLLMDRCRQFSDILRDPGLRNAFSWTRYETNQIADDLSRLPSVRFDHRLCAIAERDSWANVGKRYAALYRRLVA